MVKRSFFLSVNVIIFRFAKDRASDGMAHDCRSDLSNTAAVSMRLDLGMVTIIELQCGCYTLKEGNLSVYANMVILNAKSEQRSAVCMYRLAFTIP